MTAASLFSYYLTLNLLLVVAFATLFTLGRLRVSREGARAELRLHYLVLFSLIACTLLAAVLRPRPVFEPVMKVWAAPSLKALQVDSLRSRGVGSVELPGGARTPMFDLDPAITIALLLLAITTGVVLSRLALDLYRFKRLRQASFCLRRIGRVSILVSEEILIPFSLWTPLRAAVVVPMSLLARPAELRIAVLHELQHHRQGDTRWAYLMWALKAVCVFNPAVHLWNRWLCELQEFACDETLVDLKKVESRQYARCLLEVAQSAIEQRRPPVCATGLLFLTERKLLKRRIEKMISSNQVPSGKGLSRLAALVMLVVLAGTAVASQGVVQDRRVTIAQAETMAERVRATSGFPVVVNDLVLKELNRFLGTPEGRETMRTALQRMELYRPMIEAKIKQYQVPLDLMAIPLVESGYQNLAQSEHKGWGAGLWMFIESTARTFGLRVDQAVDERLQPEMETDAAMRLLKTDFLVFNDWQLSVLSYNTGSATVQKAIRKHGSRDPWVLIRSGVENDSKYLARVMAAVLIFRNRDSLQ